MINKIVLSPDSFKGTLSQDDFINTAEKEIRSYGFNGEIVSIPLSDGGEGSLKILKKALNLTTRKVIIHGPDGNIINSSFETSKDVAYLEVNLSCGFNQVNSSIREPLKYNSFGLGELIINSLDLGYRHIVICLGGTSTNDIGLGMMQALGYRYLDELNNEVNPFPMNFNKIKKIDITNVDKRIKECIFDAWCDVDNPLTGEKGCTKMFGKQKGFSDSQIETLDEEIKRIQLICNQNILEDKRFLGAAGGLSWAIKNFLKGNMYQGIEKFIEKTNFKELIKNADYVVTGEGKLDVQTAQGKVIKGIRDCCNDLNIKTVLIVGTYQHDLNLNEYKNSKIYSLEKISGFEEAYYNPKQALKKAIQQMLNDLQF